MLRQLSIRNVALIDALDLELEPGLTVFTGETGAGKSIVIEALSLALGGRGDSTLVGGAGKKCTVVAEFEALPPPAQAYCEALGIDAGECIVKRELRSEGRSRAFINGEPVAVSSLRGLGELLVDIHGQHAHHALLRRSVQRDLLDGRAGAMDLRAELAGICAELGRVRAALDELGGDPGALAAEVERLRHELDELDQEDLAPAALERLEQDHRRLAHMGELITGVDGALARLSDGEQSASDALAEISRELGELEGLEPSLAPLRALLEESLINLGEAARGLHQLAAGLEHDPAELEALESRLGRIHALARKHRCEPSELAAVAEQRRDRLDRLAGADERRQALQARAAELEERYGERAAALHARRVEAAAELGEEVTAALQPLGMAGARFAVDVRANLGAPPSPSGYDEVEFRFSGNAGVAMRPLAKVASGGELSRASLAIQMAASREAKLPTIVFDEVDVGIGGRVAAIVGQRLRELGEHSQVLCITHLAQVAAAGHRHLCVRKQGPPARVAVAALAGSERTAEVARMLGGLEVTESTLAHAEELIAG